MQVDRKRSFWPWAALAAALAAITVGALWLLAPVWQPGYHPIAQALPDIPDPAQADAGTSTAVQPPETGPALIDVNTATAEELTALPGIGTARAAAIVAWRAEHGTFASLADMEQIDGISARMVESWQGLAVAGNTEE